MQILILCWRGICVCMYVYIYAHKCFTVRNKIISWNAELAYIVKETELKEQT